MDASLSGNPWEISGRNLTWIDTAAHWLTVKPTGILIQTDTLWFNCTGSHWHTDWEWLALTLTHNDSHWLGVKHTDSCCHTPWFTWSHANSHILTLIHICRCKAPLFVLLSVGRAQTLLQELSVPAVLSPSAAYESQLSKYPWGVQPCMEFQSFKDKIDCHKMPVHNIIKY